MSDDDGDVIKVEEDQEGEDNERKKREVVDNDEDNDKGKDDGEERDEDRKRGHSDDRDGDRGRDKDDDRDGGERVGNGSEGSTSLLVRNLSFEIRYKYHNTPCCLFSISHLFAFLHWLILFCIGLFSPILSRF